MHFPRVIYLLYATANDTELLSTLGSALPDELCADTVVVNVPKVVLVYLYSICYFSYFILF